MSGREFTVGILGTGDAARGARDARGRPARGRRCGRVLLSQQDAVAEARRVPAARSRARCGPRSRPWRSRPGAASAAATRAASTSGSTAQGRPQMLEVNPLAGLTPGYSDLPIMAELAGMSYGALIGEILRCDVGARSMRPKIALLHDAHADDGPPRLERHAGRGAGDRGRARDARLRRRRRARRPRPRRARARAARRSRRTRSSISSSRSKAAASSCTSSRRCSSRSACRSRVARRCALGAHVAQAARRRRLLRRADIATPAVFGAAGRRRGPWIVKSVFEHASLGIDDSSVVSRHRCRRSHCSTRAAPSSAASWFAERFVPGRELNVRRHRGTGRAARLARRRDPVRRVSDRASPRSSATRRSGTPTASSIATPSARSASSPRSRRARRGSRSRAGSCSRSTAMRASTSASTAAACSTCSRSTRIPVCRPTRGLLLRSSEAGIGLHRRDRLADRRRAAARRAAQERPRDERAPDGSLSQPAEARRRRRRCASLVAATRVFYRQERAIALELLEERLRRGHEDRLLVLLRGARRRARRLLRLGAGAAHASAATTLLDRRRAPRRRGRGSAKRCMRLAERAVAAAAGGKLYIETSSRRVYERTRRFYRAAGYGRWRGCATFTPRETIRSCFVR